MKLWIVELLFSNEFADEFHWLVTDFVHILCIWDPLCMDERPIPVVCMVLPSSQLVTVDVACERAKCEQRGCLFQCMAAHDGSAGSAADVSLVADSQPPQAPRRTARLDPPWAPPPAPHVDSSNVNQLPGSAPLAALYEWRGSRPPTCTYIYFTLVRCAGPSLNTPVTTNISDKINTISS